MGAMKSQLFLIDTNIFILEGEIACSIITVMELLSFPNLTSKEESLIREKLSSLTVYNIDDAIKEEVIRLRKQKKLKLPDAIIAATAITHNAVLLTNDKGLQSISGLNSQTIALKQS